MKVEALEGSDTILGVRAAIVCKGSIEIPIWALCDIKPWPNIGVLPKPVGLLFSFVILKIADGLALQMKPRSCQEGGAIGSGQLK